MGLSAPDVKATAESRRLRANRWRLNSFLGSNPRLVLRLSSGPLVWTLAHGPVLGG